jgi:hypothetical protein
VRSLGDTTIGVEIAPGIVVEVARGAIAAKAEAAPPAIADEDDGTA